MNKLNICFTSPSTNAYSETFIQNLKSGLSGNVFHCYGEFFPFLTLKGSLQNYKTPPIFDLIKKRLGFITLPLREYYFSKYLRENKIQIIFANYGPSGAALAPVSYKMGVPLIVHFHGFDASVFKVIEKYKEGYKRMFEIASFIIVVSDEMNQDLLNLGAPEGKLIKITYSPNSRFLELKPDYQSNQILAVGRFVEKKAPYLTLMAFKSAKEKCLDLNLKFVGDGEFLSVCKDLCESMQIQGVELLGVKSPEEIASLMEQSFCFVQHSKQAINGDKEGTPVAILEAMATGLPIVATKHAGIPDVVSHKKNGFLVTEGNIEAMASCIIELYQNREKAKNFGINGKEFIRNNFSSKDYFQKINSLITTAVTNG
ncbi:glycosyltransferase [Algoriphagus vanfongensis]|uniref:glycosyltransferase n=1 Tax=Algoriphagus vanfongensis TaxID=426371 RepID=UPI0006882C6D|nr:glycosyltransferase [Algoriphagus vanfongensis]